MVPSVMTSYPSGTAMVVVVVAAEVVDWLDMCVIEFVTEAVIVVVG